MIHAKVGRRQMHNTDMSQMTLKGGEHNADSSMVACAFRQYVPPTIITFKN